MNSRLTTRTRGPSRGKQKCWPPRPTGPYLSTPAMKETTAWRTCSQELERRRKERLRLLQRPRAAPFPAVRRHPRQPTTNKTNIEGQEAQGCHAHETGDDRHRISCGRAAHA